MITLVTFIIMWLLLCTLTSAAASGGVGGGGGGGAELDGLLQEHGFSALVGPKTKTGVAYEGAVPPNLTGIGVWAMRLKSGSLMTRGVRAYHEFEIPKGVVTHPYVERLALLYHNLANCSAAYYPPLPGYTYLAPVLGLLAYDYDASSSSSSSQLQNSTHLYIHASQHPISIHFSHLLLPTTASAATLLPKCKCVFFHLNGSVTLTDMLSGNICTTFQQGHFSVVVESSSSSIIIAAAPSPLVPTPPTPRNTNSNKLLWKKIVGGVLGGFALLVMLGIIGVLAGASKYKHRKKMHRHSMEVTAEFSEALYMTAVGTTKALAAIPTRTHPKLETEYVP